MSGPNNPNLPPYQRPSSYPQAPYAPGSYPQAPYAPQPGYGQQPGFPGGGAGPAGRPKPVSITIFGILHLVIALFSLGWLTWLVAMLVIAKSNEGANPGFNNRSNDALLLIYEQMGYFQYQIFVIVLGTLLTFVLIAAGILLLIGKEKGRDLSVSYSIGSMVLTILSVIFQVYTGSVLLSSIDAPRRVSEPAGMMVLIGGLMLLPCLIYPALTLFFMTRRSVIDYLQPK